MKDLAARWFAALQRQDLARLEALWPEVRPLLSRLRSEQGRLSLAYCITNCPASAQWLLDKGVAPWQGVGRAHQPAPLHYAMALGPVSVLQQLEQAGEDPLRPLKGQPLLAALVKGQVFAQECLLWFADRAQQRGVVDAVDEEGKSALHWAVEHSLPLACQTLLDHGADLQLKDATGKSAYVKAVELSPLSENAVKVLSVFQNFQLSCMESEVKSGNRRLLGRI